MAISKHNLAPLENVGIEVDDGLLHFSPTLTKYPDILPTIVKLSRMAGSRSAQTRQAASVTDLDIGDIAPLVEAPTLIIHSLGNRLHHVGYARLLADLMPNSSLLELPGDDHWYWIADNGNDYIDAGISFITDAEVEAPVDRRFAVVMFTDIVGSTSASLESGDSDWRRHLNTHDRISRRIVTDHGGSVIKNTGDGILATFESPSQSIAAAVAFRRDLQLAGMSIRAGIHAGEIEVRDGDISGAVVNLAARVEQSAADGGIYTTKTIRDMLIGSSYRFIDSGTHPLKGFEGEWRLFSVATD